MSVSKSEGYYNTTTLGLHGQLPGPSESMRDRAEAAVRRSVPPHEVGLMMDMLFSMEFNAEAARRRSHHGHSRSRNEQ